MTCAAALERRIDAIVAEYVDPTGPGLSLLIGRGDRVVLRKGYGMANVAAREPVTPGSRFVIGSVSKQFTALAIMILKHRGVLAYDDPIGRWLPELPAWSAKVTVRQLLQHTSGVPEYLTEEFWTAAAEGRYPDLDSVLRLISGLGDLEFEPGTRWRYCNSGYVLLGAAVERASGRSFAAFLREHIFDPLGMDDTFVGETDERVPRLAVGYEYKSRNDFRPAPWHFAVIGWADGNIVSSTGDLFRWGRALYTDQLLPLSELAAAFVPCRPHDPSFSRYGFGHLISERRGVREIHHAGGTLGFVSVFTRFPDEQLTLVLLSNAAGIKLDEITGRVADLLLGDKQAPLRIMSLPAVQLEEKVGVYEGAPRGSPVRVTVRRSADGALEAEINYRHPQSQQAAELSEAPEGFVPERYELQPLARDLFCANRYTDTYLSFVREGTEVVGMRVLRGGMVQNFDRVPARTAGGRVR